MDWSKIDNKKYLSYGFPRIPTGIFEVDFCLGGGFPIGVTSNLFGVDHSFKSGLLYKVISNAQHFCWKCYNYTWECECDEPERKNILFIDAEITDWEWAERLGVKLDDEKLFVVEPEYGEIAVDVVYEALKDESCGLVIVDSLSRILPKEEIDSPAGDFKVGLRAKLLTQMINKVKSALIYRKKIGNPACFIATTQVRANIGGNTFYGDSVESSAPYALKHDWHLSVKTVKLSSEEVKEEDNTKVTAVGRFKLSVSTLKTKKKLFTLASEAQYKISLDTITSYPIGEPIDINTFIKYAKPLMAEKWTFWKYSFSTKKDMVSFFLQNKTDYLSAKRWVINKHIENKYNK